MNGDISFIINCKESEWEEADTDLLSCLSCNLDFLSHSKSLLHHLQHVGSPSVNLTPIKLKHLRRLHAGKTIRVRPGPRSKTVTEILPPIGQQHSPLKLTIKRLPTCHEPAFEVVSKKKGRVKAGDCAAMDDMIPDGRGILSPHSHSQTPSPTPSDILRQEGFLAPEALEKNEHDKADSHPLNGNPPAPPKESKRGRPKAKEKDKDKDKQEDSGISSNSEPEPSETPTYESLEPTEPPAEEQQMENGNSEVEGLLDNQKGNEQESSDSGCEKDGSEKDFAGNEKSKEASPPANTSPVGSLTILPPSALNSSIVNGSLPPEPLDSNIVSETFNILNNEQPPPVPTPPVKEGLTVKSPAALGATSTPNLLNLIPHSAPDDPLGLLRGYPMEANQGFIMETCEVCGERSENMEEHRAKMGHYKCHGSPECSVMLFSSAAELSNHRHMVHGMSHAPPPPPQQSLQQLQQQVQRLPVPYGMAPHQGMGTPPTAMGTPPPSVSPSFQHRSSPGYRVPSGVTLTYPGGPPPPAASQTPPQSPLIQPRLFAMQTSPSTIQPDGSPVSSPSLPTGLGRSISISPSVKPAQKRSTSSPVEVEATKRSRPESPDCMLVEDAQQKVPTLPSSISLTVRGSGAQAAPQGKESSGVANILASRGITVTPAVNKTPPPQSSRAIVTPQPVTTLNLSSAVSIVPANQARSQFAVPQGRSVSRQVANNNIKPPTVDLTQDSPAPLRRRPQRFTCQVCDKVFTSQETLNTHLAIHRSPSGKLPYKCNLCNAQYPTQQAMLQHKQNYHKEAQGSEMALPVVDMKNTGTIQKLTSLGIRHCLVLSQLTNSSGGVFGLPIVAIDNARNPAVCNLGALGASNVLSLGPAKALR